MTSLFAVLGVGPGATEADLRQAYLRKAREAHPDRGGNPEAFKRLRLAYDTLRDAPKRVEYERIFFAWVKRQRAVLCPKCGEVNGVPPDIVRACHTCESDLPTRPRTSLDTVADVGDRLRSRGLKVTDHAAEKLAQVGDHVVASVGDLLVEAVDVGIGAVRSKLKNAIKHRGGK